MSTSESHTFALFLRHWRLLALFTSVGLVAGAIHAFTSPKWFEARLTVVPSERSQESTVLSKLPGMGGLASSFQSDVQRIRAVLTSHSVADEIIQKFNLQKRYGEAHIEHARKALWSHCKTNVEKKSGIVELVCEDQDPKMAMELAAYFGDVGNKVFGRISASSAREERRFLETQVVQARKDVDDASRRLKEFQEKHKLIDLPEQSKAVISAMASIKGDLLSKQLELSYLSRFSSRTESAVVQLQQQIAIMDAKLKQLEASQVDTSADAGSADFFPNAMRVPELRFELEQLFREQKIKETLFFLMTQRYETAKVDEARDTSTFQILDHPTLPTYKSRPKRLRILIIGVLAGIAAGCLLIWGRSRWNARAMNPVA